MPPDFEYIIIESNLMILIAADRDWVMWVSHSINCWDEKQTMQWVCNSKLDIQLYCNRLQLPWVVMKRVYIIAVGPNLSYLTIFYTS